jgi:hypothetical protein
VTSRYATQAAQRLLGSGQGTLIIRNFIRQLENEQILASNFRISTGGSGNEWVERFQIKGLAVKPKEPL